MDLLDVFTTAYNNSFHRSIKRAPVHVNKENEKEVHDTQYINDVTKPSKYKYKVGNFVRISHKKRVFTREYQEKWSGEVF